MALWTYLESFRFCAIATRDVLGIHDVLVLVLRGVFVFGMRCGRVETGARGASTLGASRFYTAYQGWGYERSIPATILGRQALRLLHQPCWGVPAGILMNLTIAAFPFVNLL
jgi:hypothetical protein